MTDLSHPIFARFYPRLDAGCAKAGGDAHRAELRRVLRWGGELR